MMLTKKHITALNTAIQLLEEADFDQSALSLLKELKSYNVEDPNDIPIFCAAFAVYFDMDKKKTDQ
jgi:hypothetical protein